MHRPLALLIAVAALGSVPLAATAQTWPASATAGAQSMASRTTPQAQKASSLRAAELRRAAGARVLNLKPSIEVDSPPSVDLRARSEWSDDQGFRMTPTRVAFKRRF
ncbi:MAG: hypothetical protein AB1942_23165 [Pseudomonadota bacterium]